MKEFPIMTRGLGASCPSRIPWDSISPFEGQALENHGQTLERLAERGGLDPVEAFFVMTGKNWKGLYQSSPELEKEAVAFIQKVVHDRLEIVSERDRLKLQVSALKKFYDWSMDAGSWSDAGLDPKDGTRWILSAEEAEEMERLTTEVDTVLRPR